MELWYMCKLVLAFDNNLPWCAKSGNRIRVYLSSMQNKSTKIVCNPEVIIFQLIWHKSLFWNPWISLLSKWFKMNRPQTYRGTCFYVGWMRGVVLYDNSLSPWCAIAIISDLIQHPQPTHNSKPTPCTIIIHLKPPNGWLWYIVLISGLELCDVYNIDNLWDNENIVITSIIWFFYLNIIYSHMKIVSTRALSSKIIEFVWM